MVPRICPKLSWRNAERLLETMAEVCRVAESPGERNIGDFPFTQMSVGEISAAAFQSPFTNPFCNRTAFCCENSMQVADRNACHSGDECGAERRLRQMRLNEVFYSWPQLRTVAQLGIGSFRSSDATGQNVQISIKSDDPFLDAHPFRFLI
jgi:hypothetical protein